MSLTTHVPKLVNFHVGRILHRDENFSVPAFFPVEGVLAGAYGFLLLVILLPNYWLHRLTASSCDSVADCIAQNAAN